MYIDFDIKSFSASPSTVIVLFDTTVIVVILNSPPLSLQLLLQLQTLLPLHLLIEKLIIQLSSRNRV